MDKKCYEDEKKASQFRDEVRLLFNAMKDKGHKNQWDIQSSYFFL